LVLKILTGHSWILTTVEKCHRSNCQLKLFCYATFFTVPICFQMTASSSISTASLKNIASNWFIHNKQTNERTNHLSSFIDEKRQKWKCHKIDFLFPNRDSSCWRILSWSRPRSQWRGWGWLEANLKKEKRSLFCFCFLEFFFLFFFWISRRWKPANEI